MTPSAAGSPTPPPTPTPRRLPWFHFVFLTLLALTGLAGGILMWASSLRQRPAPVIIETSPPTTELPVYATLRQSLTATERSGQTVTTTALRGKVWVAAYTYTRCPRGCLGVVATMLKLRDEFSSEPRFHQVSVAVDPAYDSPEILKNFAAAAGINDTDAWWFLSGEQSSLRSFVTNQLGFAQTIEIPPAERLSEFDTLGHDLRMALIDTEGRLRGYYEVQNEDAPTAQLHQERLRADIRRLLEEK